MRERVWQMIDGEAGGDQHRDVPRVLCPESSATTAWRSGVPANYVICDADDQQTVVRDVLRGSGVPAGEWKPGENPERDQPRQERADRSARDGVAGAEPQRGDCGRGCASATTTPCARRRALDFDDLLARGLELITLRGEGIRGNGRALPARAHRRVPGHEPGAVRAGQGPHLGAREHHRGSATPTSRSTRGVRPNLRNIVNFERDFPNSRVVLLDQNYRSTRRISSRPHGP